MLGYRTEPIFIRHMTYLFITTVVSLIFSMEPVSSLELTVLNTLVCGVTALSKAHYLRQKLAEKT